MLYFRFLINAMVIVILISFACMHSWRQMCSTFWKSCEVCTTRWNMHCTYRTWIISPDRLMCSNWHIFPPQPLISWLRLKTNKAEALTVDAWRTRAPKSWISFGRPCLDWQSEQEPGVLTLKTTTAFHKNQYTEKTWQRLKYSNKKYAVNDNQDIISVIQEIYPHGYRTAVDEGGRRLWRSFHLLVSFKTFQILILLFFVWSYAVMLPHPRSYEFFTYLRMY